MISDLLQSLFTGLALGALYSIVGIGFVIIYRVTGVANLTQGALVALGAYVMSSVAGFLPWEWPSWSACWSRPSRPPSSDSRS